MSTRLLIASRVVEESWPSPSVRHLRFAPVHRNAYPAFRGGDHVQVQLGDGVRRDYSLCGSPKDTAFYDVAIRLDAGGRGGSMKFHSEVSVGDEIFVSYPQPGMAIDATAAKHVFVAGGIGVTAILGLLHELPEDAWGVIHYCVRDRADAIFVDRLESFGLPVEVHLSSGGGRLDVSALMGACDEFTTVYHCGPPELMDAIHAAAEKYDVSVVWEEFAVLGPSGARLGYPFRAVMVASERSVEVGENETLLQALLRAEVPIEFSCEGGVCGSCVVEVTEGAIDHRDRCLSESARAKGLMTACVSRARGRELKIAR